MGNTRATGPYRIVVGVDFSDASPEVLERAFDEALAHRALSPEVHAVVVVDDHGGLGVRHPHAAIKDQLETAQALLGDRVREARRSCLEGEAAPPTILTEVQVRIGDPVEQIVAVALETRASLVVVGTHGRRGLRRLVLGSVAERVARGAPCAVLIVRPQDLLAMEAVLRPEPADPGGPQAAPPEAHVFRYHSVLEPHSPNNHLL